jgi:N-acetylglucosamine transport system substrate-binding protein
MAACEEKNSETSSNIVPETGAYPENGLSRGDKVNLEFAMFDSGIGLEWIQHAIDTFMAKFPNVAINMTASPTIDTIIQTKISAGSTEDMFDIFSAVRLTWEEYADAGKLEAMGELFDRAPYDTPGTTIKELFPEYSYRYQRFKRMGKVYGLDFCIDVMGLFYEKAFFKENGWNENPQNYAEFTALCDSIKAKGVYPMTFYSGYQYGLIRPKMFELADEAGALKEFEYNFRHYMGNQYTNEFSLAMWSKVYEMGKKGYFNPGSGAISHTISQMQIIQRTSAMVASGSWIERQMMNSVPEGFEWGYMAMPFAEKAGSKIYVQQAAEDSLLIWADKPEIKKAWAKEFVLWLMNLDVQEKMVDSGLLPIREDFSEDPARVDKLQGVCRIIIDKIATGNVVTVDIGSRDAILKDPNGYGDIAWGMLNDIRVYVALGKKDPADTLAKCEEYFQKALLDGYQHIDY